MSMMRWCAVLLILVGLAGCRGEETPPEPAFANWPESLGDFRFRVERRGWCRSGFGPRGAAPGLSGVVPARALTLDSAPLTLDWTALSPHCRHHIPTPLPNWGHPAGTRRRAVRTPGPFYGNEFFHILELTPIEGGYRAYVCDGMYKIFREGEEKGKYVSVINYDSRTGLNDIGGLKVWRVEFTDTPPAAAAPAMVTAEQRGPNPAPIGDVFGPWHITGANDRSWGTPITRESIPFGEPGGVDRISECSDRMPQWRTERDAIIESVLDTPPTQSPRHPASRTARHSRTGSFTRQVLRPTVSTD